ncbi:hypothetical protein E2C01_065776 [Portunus trituberculatus]|uniref:Uncharacterized protein n=1 Tax=Portunus trituberculatus TaxID=210409 RepID=A0A5B7HS35_PORTR|nr:hypothetical protein [Portunus trituberculatus]
MNLAALHKNPQAWKRIWRVATSEDGASPENRGREDGEVVKGETATWEEPIHTARDSQTLTRTRRSKLPKPENPPSEHPTQAGKHPRIGSVPRTSPQIGRLSEVDLEPTTKQGLANTDDLEPPATKLGRKQTANASLDTTAELASAGAHLALTVLGMQDVPAKTSRGTLVEPWLAETVGPLPENS